MLEAAFIVGAIFAVAVFFAKGDPAWAERRRIRRALRKAVRTTVAEFPERALGKLVGIVGYDADRTLEAPITGRPCAAYSLIVYRERSDREDVVEHFTDVVPFRVLDDTGGALVDTSGGRIAAHIDDRSSTGDWSGETRRRQQAFLTSHGLPTESTYRFSEGVIAEGEQVAVLGFGVREPDPDPSARAGLYRSELPLRLRITGSSKLPILISDSEETLGR